MLANSTHIITAILCSSLYSLAHGMKKNLDVLIVELLAVRPVVRMGILVWLPAPFFIIDGMEQTWNRTNMNIIWLRTNMLCMPNDQYCNIIVRMHA